MHTTYLFTYISCYIQIITYRLLPVKQKLHATCTYLYLPVDNVLHMLLTEAEKQRVDAHVVDGKESRCYDVSAHADNLCVEADHRHVTKQAHVKKRPIAERQWQ